MLTLAVHFERKRTCLICCLVHAELALDAHVERPAVPLGIVAGHGSVLTIWAQGRVYTGVLCACASASAALPPADGDTILAILVSAVTFNALRLTHKVSSHSRVFALSVSRVLLEYNWHALGVRFERSYSWSALGLLFDCSWNDPALVLEWSGRLWNHLGQLLVILHLHLFGAYTGTNSGYQKTLLKKNVA